MKHPIYLQYTLENFYQNHMWYMRSVDELQLRNGDGSREGVQKLDMESSFCGRMTRVSPTDDRVLFPCGLVAASVFNDTFWLQWRKDASGEEWETLPVDSDAATISWETDYEDKHRNPQPRVAPYARVVKDDLSGGAGRYPVDSGALDFWLLGYFPPKECVPSSTFPTAEGSPLWSPNYLAHRLDVHGNKIIDCVGWGAGARTSSNGEEHGHPPTVSESAIAAAANVECRYSKQQGSLEGQTCADLNGTEKSHPHWGLESGHFVNWMRIAAFPTFRKLFGKISKTLPPNSQVRVNFVDNYEVPDVKKQLLLGNVSKIGAKNPFFPKFLVFSGVCCLLLCVVLLLVRTTKAVVVDGKKVLVWKKGA